MDIKVQSLFCFFVFCFFTALLCLHEIKLQPELTGNEPLCVKSKHWTLYRCRDQQYLRLWCVCVCHVCVCAGLCVCLCASYPQSHANNPRILRVRNLDVNLVLNCKSVLFLFVCLFFCNYFVQQLKASESKHMQQNERAKNDTMIQHHCNHTDFWPPFFCITLRLTVLSEQFRQVWNSSKAVVPKVGAQTPFNFLFSQFAANKEKVEILRPRHPLWERHGLKGNWNDQSLASATVYPWTPQLSDELSPSGVQQFWGDSADDLNLQKKVFHVLTFMWKWSLSVVCG